MYAYSSFNEITFSLSLTKITTRWLEYPALQLHRMAQKSTTSGKHLFGKHVHLN